MTQKQDTYNIRRRLQWRLDHLLAYSKLVASTYEGLRSLNPIQFTAYKMHNKRIPRLAVVLERMKKGGAQ